MKNQPMRSTVGVNRHVLHCAWGVVFTLLYLCLAQVAGAATYSQSFRNSGQGYNHHLTVEPGNHTFRMTGVPKGGVWPFNPSSRTEWYVNGSHKDTKNSYLGSSDPSYTYGQSSGTYSVSAIVYDGNWNWRESHHWNLTVRQYGSLTATIEPSGARSAGAQWRLTSGPDTGWKNSGYMLNNIPVANYTLEFRSVSGWDRPGNRTVGIIANACRMETATYTRQQGSLRVTIEPSGARSAGAQWRLTSGPDTGWKNSGAILTVPLSAYTLEYRNISGWDRPSSTSVSIQANQTISRTGTYTQPVANLGVTINPSGARSAGAQWRVTTGPDTGWKTSGTILTLPAGNYTVSYRTLAGWVTPANESVSLAAYTSNGRTGTYVEHGAFNGQINPSAVRANARWRLSGNGYDSSWQSHNTTLSVPPGSGYTLQFNDVTGWVRPGNQSVTVSSATSTGRTGTYEQPVGSLYVTLEPGAARSAGARWRLTGGPDTAWKTSGSSLNNLPVGTYTLECKSLTGWDHPANRSVTLIANATKIEEAVYVQHGTFTGQINPAEARASARWRLTRSGYDSNWQSHGVTLTVPPGSGYTLQFNEVTGWGRPANQTFSLAAATSHVRTGTYEQSQGSLRVTIEPSAARGAGAQWRLTSGPDTAWKTSGAMVTVPSGAYTLEYKSLSGWNRPASENLSIPANQTLSRTGSYAQAVGTLDVTLEPAGARSAGARWRLTSGPDTAWKTSGSQVTVPTGSYTLEFNAVSGWERPASQTVSILANQNVGRSGLYTTAPTGAALLRGTVSGRSSTGASLGTITGAQVTLSGIGARQTDSQGGYRFDNVPAGTYTLQVSATGYHAASRTVTLSAGQTRNEPVSLTATGMTGAPSGRNFRSPKGTHFLAGLPGNVNFEIEVDWQGAPGTVRYQVGGIWRPATLTALGGGLSRATVTAPLPEILFEPTPLRVEITNGAGRQTVLDNLGVHFYPVPLLMNLWFAFEIPWQGYSFSDSKELMVWDTKIPSGIYESKATVSYGRSLRFDPHAGSLFASLSGSGAVKAELKFDGVEQLGEGEATLAGTNITTFRGLEPARHDPALTLGVHGMAGVGAPAVRVISGIFPPAASVIEPLRKVPVVKDVLEALRLRAFLTGGLEMEALFDLDNPHDNWLGVTDLDAAGSIGLEGQAVLELWGAEAGAYIGGSAGPKFKLYPELAFEEMVLRGYVGAYASAWLFEYSAEIGTEVTFRPGGEAQMQQLGMPVGTRSLLALGPVTGEIPPVRHPVGHRSQRWGAANRLPAAPTAGRQLTLGVSPPQGLAAWTQMHGTPLGAAPAAGVESRVLENVLPIASPALGVGADGARILFTSYDAERPWYAATEIGELTLPTGMTHWNLEMLPGNQAAAFTPSLADAATAEEPVMMPHEAGGLPSAAPRAVAAWTRITGDASAAEGPEDIAPLLDIVVARRDAQSGAWGDPVQLTDNGAVSRQPRVYAVEQMGFELLLWIQNEGDATLGNSEQPDRLMASFWEGSEWMAPEVLATLDRGLVDYAFTVDALGAPRLVLVVDEDGDAESRDDRELYALDAETMDLIRLTQDALPDEKPMLVAPNGEALCVWLKDGALHYSALETWLPRPLFADEELAGVSPSLQGLTMPNGAVIAYTAQLESGVDIVASFYDAQLDRWSLPTRLTDDAHVESSLSLAWDDEADALVAAYLKTETVRADIELDFNGELHTVADVPQPGRTDLYVLHYTLGHDLALAPDSLRSLPANPAPGSLAELRAVVRNQGEMSADVTVEFYDGDPLQGGSLIEGVFLAAEELVPGGEVEVTIPWEVPADAVPQRVWAVVDPELDLDDRDRANNSATRTTVLPDLLVASAQAHEVSPTAVELVVTLENDGVLTPADHFLVEWRNEEDTVVASALAEPMAPGTSQDVAALWDCGPGSATDAFRTLQIQVLPQADDDDFTLENNTYAQTVALPQADPEAEWLHAVEPAAPLHGAAAATGQTLQVIAVADWTCTADADWLTVTAGAAGTGSGAVTYDLAANPGAEARTGTLVLAAGAAQHIVTVTQAGMAEAVLRYTAGAGGTLQGETTQRIALGGAGSPVEAMAQPGFVFERWSDGFAAALRTDTQVTGDLEVTAQFAALALDLVPAHRAHPAAGATGQAFAVEANTAWTAVADEAWLVITSGASGTGSDAVVYDVAVNVGPARTGSVTVAGEGLARTFTVTQAGAALTAPVFNPPAGTYAAGTRSVTVTAAVGADIRYTMGAGEAPGADPTEASAALAGEGIVEVPVPGWLKARAWQTGYEPSPVTVAVYVSATGAQYALTVEQGTGSGAYAADTTVAVTAAAPPAGSIFAHWTVAPAAYAGRLADATAASTAFSVPAAAVTLTAHYTPVALQLAPAYRYHGPAVAADQTLAVNANIDWSAATAESWLTVTAGAAGSGDGSVVYALDANSSPTPRSGTITVTGGGLERTFAVHQAGATAGTGEAVGWRYPRQDRLGHGSLPQGSTFRTGNELVLLNSLPTATEVLTGDVTGDGRLEIVALSGNQLRIHNGQGETVNTITLPRNDNNLGMLEDIDGDGAAEIFVGGGRSGFTAYVYKADGTRLKSLAGTNAGSYGDVWMRPIGWSDGKVLMGYWSGYARTPRGVSVFDYASAQQLWYYQIGPICVNFSVGDMDGNGVLNMLMGTFSPHNGASGNGMNDSNTYLVVVDQNGTKNLSQLYPSPTKGHTYNHFADMTGDGLLEIVAFKGHDPTYYKGPARIHVFGRNGAVLHEFVGPQNDSWSYALGDLDGNGRLEVVAVPSRTLETIYVLDSDLNVLRQGPANGGRVQLLADLTGDGHQEIVLLSATGLLTVLDQNLAEIATLQVGTGSGSVIASDVTGDGRIELICRTDALHLVHFAGGSPGVGQELFLEDFESGDYTQTLNRWNHSSTSWTATVNPGGVPADGKYLYTDDRLNYGLYFSSKEGFEYVGRDIEYSAHMQAGSAGFADQRYAHLYVAQGTGTVKSSFVYLRIYGSNHGSSPSGATPRPNQVEGGVLYVNESGQYAWETLSGSAVSNGNAWNLGAIRIRPDGRVEFSVNDELLYTSTRQVLPDWDGQAPIMVGGRKSNYDNLRVRLLAGGTTPGVYTLTYTAGAGGTIAGATPQTVAHGEDGATVTATPAAGHRFVQWSDGVPTASRRETNVTGNLSVAAEFVAAQYTLSYTAGAGGAITGPTSQTVAHGDDGAAVTAVAATGYRFVQWSDGVPTASRQDLNVTDDMRVTAELAALEYTLRYTAGAGGTITGPTPQTVVHSDDGAAVTAAAAAGYRFVQWSDGLATAGREDLNVTDDLSVTAEFAALEYTLRYTAGAGGTIAGATPQTVAHGAAGTAVTAVAAEGYRFVQWSDGRLTAERQDLNVTGDLSVAAEFSRLQYTLTYTAGVGGTLAGPTPQPVMHGDDGALVTAVPASGHQFVQWNDGVQTAARRDLNVTRDLDLTAAFIPNVLTLAPAGREHASPASAGWTLGVEANVAWTASSAADWIEVTAGETGFGNGTVTYRLEANAGPARSGSIRVAGGDLERECTVQQAGATLPLPVFDPDGGEQAGTWVSVAVSSPAVGAQVRYTVGAGATPGSDPTAADSLVPADGRVTVPVPGWLKARAWQDGYEPSPVKTALFAAGGRFCDAFERSAVGGDWTVVSGSWSLTQNELSGYWSWSAAQTDQGVILLNEALYDPAAFAATVRVQVRTGGQNGGERIVLRAGANNQILIAFSPIQRGVSPHVRKNGAAYVSFATAQDVEAFVAEVGAFNEYTVVKTDTLVTVYVNGVFVLEFEDVYFGGATKLGLATYGQSYYDRFCISAPAADDEGDDEPAVECGGLRLTAGLYTETQNLAAAVQGELGAGYAVADWNDLKALPDVAAWIACLGLENDQTFMLTRNGQFRYSGSRQYYVHYSPDGLPYSNFLVHDRIDNVLWLGSWYGLNQPVLAKNLDGTVPPDALTVEPTSRDQAAVGEAGQTIHVVANLSWTAVSQADWLTVTAGASGSGNGTVTYTVAPNAGPSRGGAIRIAGGGLERLFTVFQAGVPAAAPVFSPAGGVHAGDEVSVTLTTDTAGALIHYTLDGSEPTAESPSVASGEAVTVPLPGVLTAQARHPELDASAVSSAQYARLDAELPLVEYTLTYTAGVGGTLTGDTLQTVAHGADGLPVTALPAEGYHLVQWSDGITSATRQELNVSAELNVTAEFALNTHTLRYRAGSAGTLAGPALQTVTHGGAGQPVTAVADEGFVFVRWSDGVTTPERQDTNIAGALDVTAEYAVRTYALEYAAAANGSVSGAASQAVAHGQDGSPVAAVADEGYSFTQWSDGLTDVERQDLSITADLSVTAEFAVNQYTVVYTAGPNGAIAGTTPQTVAHGADAAPVTAAPDAGYRFVAWSDGLTEAARHDLGITGDLEVTAEFAVALRTLTYTAGPNGGIEGDTPQTIEYGADGSPVTAVADEGYHFVQWSDGQTEATRQDLSVTSALSVTAEFAINEYTLTYTAGPNGSIDGETAQTVAHGADGAPVTAVAEEGYRFVIWSDGVTANPRTDRAVTGDVTVQAEFDTWWKQPDFVVQSLVLEPAPTEPGQTFTAQVTVLNQGDIIGDAGLLRIWTSRAGTAAAGEPGDAQQPAGALAAGESRTLTFAGLTAAGTEGTHHFRAFVDADGVTAEKSEGNNQQSVTYVVPETPSWLKPDFVITELTLEPVPSVTGAEFTLHATVLNQGDVAGDGGVLRAWASRGGSAPVGEAGDAEQAVGLLAAGASRTLTFPGLAAAARAGTHHARVFVDADGQTAEKSEGNNQKSRTYRVWDIRLEVFDHPLGKELRWNSRRGLSYRVLRATDLTGGFEVLAAGLADTAPENVYLDENPPAEGSLFYTIEVE